MKITVLIWAVLSAIPLISASKAQQGMARTIRKQQKRLFGNGGPQLEFNRLNENIFVRTRQDSFGEK